MLKLNSSDTHLLVLITMNPNHPRIMEIFGYLTEQGKAVALQILRQKNRPLSMQLPKVREHFSASFSSEIGAAAEAFVRMAASRVRQKQTKQQTREHRALAFA